MLTPPCPDLGEPYGDAECKHCKLPIEWRQEYVAHERGEGDRSKWEPYYG